MAELFTLIRPSMAAAGLLAALALGGCAATNVTDSWQCPLAQGKACTSVSAADPAVPQTADPAGLATRTPLYGERPAAPPAPSCTSGCNPFAWFASLFEADAGEVEASVDRAGPGGAPAERSKADEAAAGATQADAGDAAPIDVVEAPLGLPSVPLPAEESLRTDEVIGRIWIAPFVDENGVYHEASWVRAVFEAAGWRLK